MRNTPPPKQNSKPFEYHHLLGSTHMPWWCTPEPNVPGAATCALSAHQCWVLAAENRWRNLANINFGNTVGFKTKVKMWSNHTERQLYVFSNLLNFFSKLPILDQFRKTSSNADPALERRWKFLLERKIRPACCNCSWRSLKVAGALLWMV